MSNVRKHLLERIYSLPGTTVHTVGVGGKAQLHVQAQGGGGTSLQEIARLKSRIRALEATLELIDLSIDEQYGVTEPERLRLYINRVLP